MNLFLRNVLYSFPLFLPIRLEADIGIPKRYKKTSIYLEFEGLIGIDDKVRHYAFPKGDEGVSLLPILIRLPEDTRDFDINTVKDALKPTIFSQFGHAS